MAELTIRLDLSFGARSMRGLMTAAMIFSAVTEVASESVTLTTYYPAPSGVYTQMITTGNTFLARDGGKVGIGTTAMQGRLDVVGVAGANTIVARPVDNSDAVRVTPSADGQASVAFGVTNSANNAWTAYMRKNGDGYFGGNLGVGTQSPGVRLEVLNGSAIRVGVATLSDGANFYMNLANHEYYNGTSWISDGQPGALLQFVGQGVNFYTHNGLGTHVGTGGFSSSGDFSAAHNVVSGVNACWPVNVTPNGMATGGTCPTGDYLTNIGNFYANLVTMPFYMDPFHAQMPLDALCCPCPTFSKCVF